MPLNVGRLSCRCCAKTCRHLFGAACGRLGVKYQRCTPERSRLVMELPWLPSVAGFLGLFKSPLSFLTDKSFSSGKIKSH